MAAPTRYFYELTPDRIHQAFAQADLRLKPGVRFLNSMENRVVSVEDEDGRRWVGKFYRPGRWSPEALGEEHQFLEELAAEGLPVAPPLRLGQGGTLGRVSGIWFALFPHLQGRPLDELAGPHLRVLGRLVGRIHRVGARRPALHRPRIGPRSWGLEALEELRQEQVVPEDLWRRYETLVRRLVAATEPLFSGVESIRVHGDMHRGNLLWSSQGPAVVDFDDFGMGPPVQDLWMLVPARDEEARSLREVFLESYEEERAFDRATLRLIEPLRALRFVKYAAWVARRRKDPAFVKVFPDVESRSFWQRELEDLENQLERLGEG